MTDAVEDLSKALVDWMRERRKLVDWVYHPRKTEFSDFIRRKVLADLLATSAPLREAARSGRIACDLNVSLSRKGGRTRKLDLVVGTPVSPLAVAAGPDVLRKAKIAVPKLTLETKLCMTEHRKATSRLIDELLSSLDVVRAVGGPDATCIAVVVINVGARFTSPLNLPGPNVHDRPHEIERLAAKIFDRVPIGGDGYTAVAMSLVDFDNETRFEIGSGIDIPTDRQYVSAMAALARTWHAAE